VVKSKGMHGALEIMGVPKVEGGSAAASGRSRSQGHSQDDVNLPDVARSGRCGEWVYYMLGNKQCRRRYVVPKDPRTAKQLRCRAALATASRAWSHSSELTQEDRRDWCAEGAKAESRVRLVQSGSLTGQQHFVGRNCAKGRSGLGLLVRPEVGEGRAVRGEVRGANSADRSLKTAIRRLNRVRLCGRLDGAGWLVRRRPTWGQCRSWAGAGLGMGWGGRRKAEFGVQTGAEAEVRWSGRRWERWRGG
jgi:hypothetical protein